MICCFFVKSNNKYSQWLQSKSLDMTPNCSPLVAVYPPRGCRGVVGGAWRSTPQKQHLMQASNSRRNHMRSRLSPSRSAYTLVFSWHHSRHSILRVVSCSSVLSESAGTERLLSFDRIPLWTETSLPEGRQ